MFPISLNCTCFVKVIEAFPPKFRTFATKLDPLPLVGRNGAWSEQDKLEIFWHLSQSFETPPQPLLRTPLTYVSFNLRKFYYKALLKLHGMFLCPVFVLWFTRLSSFSCHYSIILLTSVRVTDSSWESWTRCESDWSSCKVCMNEPRNWTNF